MIVSGTPTRNSASPTNPEFIVGLSIAMRASPHGINVSGCASKFQTKGVTGGWAVDLTSRNVFTFGSYLATVSERPWQSRCSTSLGTSPAFFGFVGVDREGRIVGNSGPKVSVGEWGVQYKVVGKVIFPGIHFIVEEKAHPVSV